MLALMFAATAAPSEILLADFKGTQGATFKWKANNDPVRGSAPTHRRAACSNLALGCHCHRRAVAADAAELICMLDSSLRR